jgi:hypothetical protein
MLTPIRSAIICCSFFLCLFTITPSHAQSGNITTVVGNGTAAYSGESVVAVSSSVNHPAELVIDGSGNTYFSELNSNRIRKVSPSGIITTIAGTGVAGYSGDGGPATAARLNMPFGIDIDNAGNIYFADCLNHRVRRISTSGIITTVAGNGTGGFSGNGGAATAAAMLGPTYIRFDHSGNLYISDNSNNMLRKVNTSGIITTIAGTGFIGYTGDGGAATNARLYSPSGMAVDLSGNVYLCDYGNNVVRKISAAGIISTFAGTGVAGYTGDGGPATAARFKSVQDVVIDAAGNFILADTKNHVVRKINTSGIISTIAGTGIAGFSGDGGPATAANFKEPGGFGIDPTGNLHIADVFNHRIRKYITSTDSTPYFTFSGVPTLYLCLTEGFLTTPIDTYLTAYDANVSQTLTWNALMSPSNGILSGTYSTLSTGAAVTPSGFTYTPTLGYIGTDSFSYTINDGIGYDTIKLYAFMNTTPTAGIISGDDSVCVGDTAHLSSTIAGGVWSTLNPSISTISTSGILTGVASGVDSVVYTVTNHCGTDTSYFPVVIIDGQLCNASLNGSHNSLSFKVFPNPNNGQFNIQFPNHTSKDILVTVRNVYGQVVGTVNVKDAKQTSVKMDIPAGIYSVEAVTANSKYTQMLIVR